MESTLDIVEDQPAARPALDWLRPTGIAAGTARQLVYRGPLAGNQLRLHYGFDGWQWPVQDAVLEPLVGGGYVAEIPDAAGHLALDCAVTDGEAWDNNTGADYRLWLTIDPFDAHLHVSSDDDVNHGLAALRIALTSAGISAGLSSWPDNQDMSHVAGGPALRSLVWVRPGLTPPDEVRRLLAGGFVGLKFHPTTDGFRPDDPAMDPYLEVAALARVPAAIHSAPGEADPDGIRRLAERHPDVPILLYHTFLGPVEGRERAVAHALEQPNLYLETSWCPSDQILDFVRAVGPRRVIFGSDASLDGCVHYLRQPPNIEGRETYNQALLRLAGELVPASARLVTGDNARRLFGLADVPLRFSRIPSDPRPLRRAWHSPEFPSKAA
jgi:hypothetical protein